MAVWIAHSPNGPRADRYFTQTVVTADAFARVEFTATAMQQPNAPIEFRAATTAAVTGDARSPVEVLGAPEMG
jgi:hypothetical protein